MENPSCDYCGADMTVEDRRHVRACDKCFEEYGKHKRKIMAEIEGVYGLKVKMEWTSILKHTLDDVTIVVNGQTFKRTFNWNMDMDFRERAAMLGKNLQEIGRMIEKQARHGKPHEDGYFSLF